MRGGCWVQSGLRLDTPRKKKNASKGVGAAAAAIIAHIDHGKSTLADRLLQYTCTVEEREMQSQLLDNMDIERERGITIKLQAARMNYLAKDGKWYVLNLIDTPGHVDFSYEVSRSLAACEGALLVVDASQGVEAQTIANVYLALDNDLEIVPVLNKIDLPGADIDRVSEEVENTIGLDCTDAIPASAKLASACPRSSRRSCSAPEGRRSGDLLLASGGRRAARALIFDSYYDAYRGVVVFIRVVDGELRKGDKIRFARRDGVRRARVRHARARRRSSRATCCARARWATCTRHQERQRRARGRHDQRAPSDDADGAAARGYQEPCRSSTAASSRSRRRSTSCCASRSASSASTTPRCASSRRPRRRWASASAAASSACCTWRSCRSASSASTTST